MSSAVKGINAEAIPEGYGGQEPSVTVFVCANCARPGKKSTSAGRSRPTVPDFDWPFPVEQIIVPCAGRIQPEHILKTFESGADLVSVVACDTGNCHYIEGSTRCARRVDFIRSILAEIGLGDERLLLTFLPGSAGEDLLADAGKAASAENTDSLGERIASVRDETIRALELLPPNPLRQAEADVVPGSESREGLETTNENAEK